VPNSERLTFEPNSAIPVGATVAVSLPGRYLLLGASLVYGVPLAALLAGAAFGGTLGRSDLSAAAGAVLAVVGALLAAPALRRRLERATLRRLAVRRVA
jgi:positive regulator of sigma E activity